MREMFFGTRERFTSVACPAINVGTSSVGWSNSGTFENGGGFVDESTGSHKEYDMSWNLLDAVSARIISDYAEKIYGSGPIYFYLPGTLDQNVFPADVAAPGRAVDGGASLVKGVRPMAVVTPANNANLPVRSASYTLTSGSVAREIYLPVPSGYTLHLSGYGSATGTARVAGEAPLNTVATNLVTNPSFEATSSPVEVRRNRAVIPAPGSESGPGPLVGTGWGTGGAGTLTYPVAFYDPNWVRATRMTWTVAPTAVPAAGSDIMYAVSDNRVAVTPGVPETFSVMVRSSRAQSVSLHGQWLTASGGGAGGDRTPSVTLVPGVWTRLTLTSTPTPTAATLRVDLDTGANPVLWQVGDYLDATRLMIGPGDYFDGQMSPDPDLTPAWLGAPYASQSVLNGLGVATTNQNLGRQASVSSTQWSASGGRSLRIIPTGDNPDTHTSVGGDTGGMRLGMQAGKTYTALATIRLAAPQEGLVSGPARRIRPYYRDAGGAYRTIDSPQAPNLAGVYQIRHTFTLPADATEAFIRLYNGAAQGGGDVWWDDFLLVEGEYTGSYFDGSQPPALAKNYATNSVLTGASDVSYQGGTGEVSGQIVMTDVSDGPLPDVNSYVRRTITTPKSTSGSGFFSYNRAPAPASMGTTWNAAVWLRPSVPIRMRMTVSGRTSSSLAVGGTSSADAVELPANVWTRVVGAPLTLTADAQAIGWWAVIDNASIIPAGGTIDVAAPMVVSGSEVPPFFSGASPDGMWLGYTNYSASIRYDTAYRVAWTGTANASTSILHTGGTRVLTLDGNPQAFEGPTGVTFKASGTGNLTLSGLMAQLLPNDDHPVNVGWISGQGHSGVRFANRPQTSTYSAVLDKYSVSAKFVEVGLWE